MYVKRRSPPSSAHSSANASIRARALDVDRQRRAQRQVEGHRRRAVDDLRDLRRDLERDVGVQAEALVRDVAGERAHAVQVRLRRAERARERLLQPLAGVLVVVGADEHEHVAVGELQVAREQLDPDEAGRAGEQDARRAAQPPPPPAASSSSIASPIPCAMRSASSASSDCA